MSTQPNILVVGHDPMLLQSRRLILGTYFDVTAAGRVSEAGTMLARHNFGLVVLCDTLTDTECDQIGELIRDRNPPPKVFSLLGPGSKNREKSLGRRLECSGGPLQLVRECADALGFDLRKRA